MPARLIAVVFGSMIIAAAGVISRASPAFPEVINLDGGTNLQQIIDAAPSNSVIQFNPNERLVLSKSIEINKPLTLRGINAALPEKLGGVPLIIVKAEGVAIEDFQLFGNTGLIPSLRPTPAPLILIRAGDFRVERGLVVESSRHGVFVAPDRQTGDIIGGVIRDIIGRGNDRCVVSIGDGSTNRVLVRNVLIENIRCYGSLERGAVNVKDGTDNITVRKVYSENSTYAVDVQDHDAPGQINSNVLVEDVYALKCRQAIRTDNSPQGHVNLTLRDVTAEQCTIPIRISNTRNLTLDNIRVLNHIVGKKPAPPIAISNCNNVFVRHVTIENSPYVGPAFLLENCDETTVDGVTLRGETNATTSGINYHISVAQNFSGLRIVNASLLDVNGPGILLDAEGRAGTLSGYIISGNLAQVDDRIHGKNNIVVDNFSTNKKLPDNNTKTIQ